MPKTEFELAIEASTGWTVEQIQGMPLDEMRRLTEERFGRPTEFIGGGEELLSHAQVEVLLTEALR